MSDVAVCRDCGSSRNHRKGYDEAASWLTCGRCGRLLQHSAGPDKVTPRVVTVGDCAPDCTVSVVLETKGPDVTAPGVVALAGLMAEYWRCQEVLRARSREVVSALDSYWRLHKAYDDAHGYPVDQSQAAERFPEAYDPAKTDPPEEYRFGG